MVTVDEIIKEISQHKLEFDRIYKCLNKTKQAKKQTVQSNLKLIISEYNCIKSSYINFNHLLNNDYQLYLLQLLTKTHNRLLKVFERLKLHIQIPKLELPIVENIDSDSESEGE